MPKETAGIVVDNTDVYRQINRKDYIFGWIVYGRLHARLTRG